jgi:hypothetical protein|tara:strand:- start:26001 stop:26321 length:321 start_codon:yes stop_codon:yes gene_type:complete
MDYLNIGNKDYPFVISASAAKHYFSKGEDAQASMSAGIDIQLDLIYEGLKDGSLCNSWVQRNFTKRLPSKNKVSRMVTIEQMNKAIALIFPAPEKVEGEAETDGKK